MEALRKNKIRKYYKFQDKTWTQPTLTSNGSFGGDNMAVYCVFGGNNGAWGTAYTAFSPNGGIVGFYCDEWKSSMYFCVYIPKAIRLTRISFYIPHRADSSGGAYNTLLYGGYSANDRRELIRNIGTVGENSTCNITLTTPNYYQFYTLYFENGGHSYEDRVEIQSIRFEGVYREAIEATSVDYNFYKDIYTINTPKINNEYYALEGET